MWMDDVNEPADGTIGPPVHLSFATFAQSTDARQRRTRTTLVQAILELSAISPASSISVLDVTARAGIFRSTFYAHAPSPLELLCTALNDDLLARLREPELNEPAGRTGPSVLKDVTDHIDEHWAVYRCSLQSPVAASAVFQVISEHASIRFERRASLHGVQAMVLAAGCAAVYRQTVAAGEPDLGAAVRRLLETEHPAYRVGLTV